MSGYDNFKLRTTLDGANSRESKINDARHILELEFTNDPSYCDSMYRWIPAPCQRGSRGIRRPVRAA